MQRTPPALAINDIKESSGNKDYSPPKGLADAFIRHLLPQDKRYDVADKSCQGLPISNKNWCIRGEILLLVLNDPETNKLKMLTFGGYEDAQFYFALSRLRKIFSGQLNHGQNGVYRR